MVFISKNEKETLEFAKKFAKTLGGGEIICLIGDLGRGKTIFVKGLAKGLGIKKYITSPTFVLMKIYPVNKKPSAIKCLCHIDAYRINQPHELVDIGALEYFSQKDAICVIEWADKIKKILPQRRIEIKFKLGKKENERRIHVTRNT